MQRKEKKKAQKCARANICLFRETPPTTSGGERRVVTHDANAQDLLGADQDHIFRFVRHAVKAQVVGLFEVQRGVRARDAPARVAHASDDAVEVAWKEDGHLRVRLVHLDTQDTILVTTPLSNAGEEKKNPTSQQRAMKGTMYGDPQSWHT